MDHIIPYQIPETAFYEYDPEFPKVFFQVAELIKRESQFATVEHIGSTSVPGMPGKNSLNIAVIVERMEYPILLNSLKNKGFGDHPFKSEPEDRPLLVGGVTHNDQIYWLHVHLITENSKDHIVALYFRDILRGNPKIATEYAALKKQLVEEKASAEEYHQGKQAFIRSIITQNE